MSAQDMDRCLQRLRYVREGDYVLTEDVNVPRDCLYIARDWMLSICYKYSIDPKYVYELDPYLSKLRFVQAGDIIEPEDHNNIVDALRKLREVLEKIETLVYQEGFQEGYAAGGYRCKPRLDINPPPPTELMRRVTSAFEVNPTPPAETYKRIGLQLTVEVS